MNYQHLTDTAIALGCTVTADAPMAQATTFRIGGPADRLIDLPVAAVGPILTLCRQEGIPYLFIGNGSNLLVGDKGIRGAVLRLADDGTDPVLLEDNRLYAPCGMQLKRLCIFAREQSLTGLEFAFGIPGTVGGAVYMNAGAYDGEMAQIIESVDCVTPDGEPITLTADQLGLGYRHSALMDNGYIAVGATLRLAPGDYDTIAATMKDLMHRRQEKQPLEYPSAGSFFKRPAGYFAGKLVQDAGLKGFTVGGAQVSEKHAGFVVNRGGATAADMVELCRQVQEKIMEINGVRLEPEVRFIGEF